MIRYIQNAYVLFSRNGGIEEEKEIRNLGHRQSTVGTDEDSVFCIRRRFIHPLGRTPGQRYLVRAGLMDVILCAV